MGTRTHPLTFLCLIYLAVKEQKYIQYHIKENYWRVCASNAPDIPQPTRLSEEHSITILLSFMINLF